MEQFVIDSKYRIQGKTSFQGLSYKYLSEEKGEMLELKFMTEEKEIYLRFYSSIISFRHREVHGASEYNNIGGNSNMVDKLYVMQNSNYIKNLNINSDGLVSEIYGNFGEIKHYVVLDYQEEYYFDIVTNTEPEIAIEKIVK